MTEDEVSADTSEESPDMFRGRVVNFPALPKDENPEDGEALRLIVTGQAGQGNLYRVLEPTLSGDKAFLVSMLRRDWERHCPELITEGRRLLAKFSGVDETALGDIEARPSIDEITALCADAPHGTAAELLEFLGAFARRSFVCARLIPWKSDAESVFVFFANCVEAEDHHMELMAQFASLVEGPAPAA